MMQLYDKRRQHLERKILQKEQNRAVIKQTIKLINSVRNGHSWRAFTEILLLSLCLFLSLEINLKLDSLLGIYLYLFLV